MYTLNTPIEDSIVYQSTLLPKAFIKPCLVYPTRLASSTLDEYHIENCLAS